MSSIYPFSKMNVGDSVIMIGKKRGTVNMAAYQYRQKVPESHFRVQNAMAGIAITRQADRTDVVVPPPQEPSIHAYVTTIDGLTILYGPCQYEEARSAKVRCEEAIGQPLVIAMSEDDLGAGILNTI